MLLFFLTFVRWEWAISNAGYKIVVREFGQFMLIVREFTLVFSVLFCFIFVGVVNENSNKGLGMRKWGCVRDSF